MTRITEPPGYAHPKIRAVFEYWRGLAPGAELLPARKQIDPVAIPKLLDNVWMVDVVGDPKRFRFRLIGGAGQRLGAPGKVGDFLDETLPGKAADPALDEFRFAAVEGKPFWYRGKPAALYKTQMVELERIYLPLAADGRNVDTLLCLSVYFTTSGQEI